MSPHVLFHGLELNLYVVLKDHFVFHGEILTFLFFCRLQCGVFGNGLGVIWLYKWEPSRFAVTRPSVSHCTTTTRPPLTSCGQIKLLQFWFHTVEQITLRAANHLHFEFAKLTICYFDILGGKAVGNAEEPSSHELRQTESLFALLLRKRNYAKGIAPYQVFFCFVSSSSLCCLFKFKLIFYFHTNNTKAFMGIMLWLYMSNYNCFICKIYV